jgi:hypothetical protein
MQNPFKKIDKHLIMNQIFDYLYFKDIVQLSKTNQEFYKMFKLTLEKNKIKKLILNSIYRPKLWSEFQFILNNLNPPENLTVPPDMIQLLDYSTTKNTIKYKYIPVGIYKNIFYPVLNQNIKILSYQVQYPRLITPMIEKMDDFFNNFEKIEDNSKMVYSIQYIHPLLKFTIYRYMNIIFFTAMIFLAYFIFVFTFLLMKNNFLKSDDQIIYFSSDINYNNNFEFDYNNPSFVTLYKPLNKDFIFYINNSNYNENICYL